MKKEVLQELVKKYNIDLESLEKEQIKLSNNLDLKKDFKIEEDFLVAGVDSVFEKNSIISAIVVCDKDLEIVERAYFKEKLKFPFIKEFRAYRELNSMVMCFNKLETKPDLIFVKGEGINHPRLGIASHFSLSTSVPVIGVIDNLNFGEVKNQDVVLNGKIKGKVFQSKKGSKPLFVSPGDLIDLKNSLKLVKDFIQPPHKFPEPLHLAHKYAKKIRTELRV